MIHAHMEAWNFSSRTRTCKRSPSPGSGEDSAWRQADFGLGAGANPEVGRRAALEDTDKLIEVLEGATWFLSARFGRRRYGAAPIVGAAGQ